MNGLKRNEYLLNCELIFAKNIWINFSDIFLQSFFFLVRIKYSLLCKIFCVKWSKMKFLPFPQRTIFIQLKTIGFYLNYYNTYVLIFVFIKMFIFSLIFVGLFLLLGNIGHSSTRMQHIRRMLFQMQLLWIMWQRM